MNVKRNKTGIITALTVILSATPVFAHLDYAYTPAGVWVPRPHAYTLEEIKTACKSKEFNLLAGLDEAVTGLPKAVGNLFEAILPGEKQKPEKEVSKVTEYKEIQNASGVIVRIPRY